MAQIKRPLVPIAPGELRVDDGSGAGSQSGSKTGMGVQPLPNPEASRGRSSARQTTLESHTERSPKKEVSDA